MITENSRKGEYRIILQYLKSLRGNGEGWMKAGLIRSFATPFGFVGFRGDRNVRELVEMGYLERVYRGKTFDEPGRFAWVRYKIKAPQTLFREDEERRLVMASQG